MDLERDFEVLRVAESQDDRWDFMFNQLGDETRERNLYRESFKHGLASYPTESLPDPDGVARAAYAVSHSTDFGGELSDLIALNRWCLKRLESPIILTSVIPCSGAPENSMYRTQFPSLRKTTVLRK